MSNHALDTWLGSSKLVDDSGAPLVMYHGSPDTNFDRFREDQFFTPDMDYARRFLSSATSSSSFYGVRDRKPGIFSVHLRCEKPFDTRDPEHAKILRDRFSGIHGEGVLTEQGLPDWVEGRDIAAWLREELPGEGFDAVIVDEGRDEAGQRPFSYIIFSADQIRVLAVSEPVSEPEFAQEPDEVEPFNEATSLM